MLGCTAPDSMHRHSTEQCRSTSAVVSQVFASFISETSPLLEYGAVVHGLVVHDVSGNISDGTSGFVNDLPRGIFILHGRLCVARYKSRSMNEQ